MRKASPIVAAEWDASRVWSKVPQGAADACWLWAGWRDAKGYGRIERRGVIYKAHRVVYALVHGSIDECLVIDHLCRQPACVNPAHLEATSQRVNTARGIGPTAAAAAAQLAGHCVNGHLLSRVGFHRQGGSLTCAECGRRRVARYRARKKVAA